MTALLLSLILATSIPTPADAVPREVERGCSRTLPTHVLVFRRHKAGSSVPARIDRVPLALYVGRILASGAMPADRPMEALKAMAAVVQARVHWLACHPRRGMRWRGRVFTVTDGSKPRWCSSCDHGMLYRPVYVHSRIRAAVRAVDGVLLRKPGRMAKPAWSGPPARCGAGITGNRLPAQAAAACARRGWRWQRIVRTYIRRVSIEEAR